MLLRSLDADLGRMEKPGFMQRSSLWAVPVGCRLQVLRANVGVEKQKGADDRPY